MNILKRLFGVKDSQTRIAMSVRQVGQAISTPRNYESFSNEGYKKNVTVFRCVSMIANAAAGIEWDVYSKRMGAAQVEFENHPLTDLLKKPNPMQGQSEFLEAVFAYYILTGDTFIEANKPSPKKPPLELWSVRPDKMKIIPNSRGYVGEYQFVNGDAKRSFIVDPITMQSLIMHMKSFNPTNEWWGQSPMEAALLALDQNNQGQRWNLALLQNSATPSGVMQVKVSDANPSGSLSSDEYDRLKEEIENEYMGARRAGRPMLLEGGMEWKQIALSPKDMDFLNNKNVTAVDICEAFGVPPEMLGLGQKTYKNFEEARLSFYEDTILPLMDKFQDKLNSWLVPQFGEGLVLKYDKDDIEALWPRRQIKYETIKDATYLTVNEKRVAAGYDSMPGWDIFLINNQAVSDPEDLMMDEPQEEILPDETITPEPAAKPETEQEDEQDSEEGVSSEKGFKSINLVNRREKRGSWKQQNALRRKLEKEFIGDLNADFAKMSKEFADQIKEGITAQSLEFALYREMDEHMENIEKTLKTHIKITIETFGNQFFEQAKSAFPQSIETKSTKQWNDWAKRYVDKKAGQAITHIQGTTKKQVQRTVKQYTEQVVLGDTSVTEFANSIEDKFENLSAGRSRTIARTEVASASNNASLEAAKSLNIPNLKKEWVSSQDDRVRDGGHDGNGPDHESMDGEEVGINEKFNVPPDADMDGPGDPSGGADQVCNCRCVLVYK